MSLIEGVSAFTQELTARKIPFGVIGGLAVFAYGGERATFDIDLLVPGKQQTAIQEIGRILSLVVVNENPEVIQFSGKSHIDVIFANRPHSQAMLSRLRTVGRLPYPVVAPEDLIGLKIQAFAGDRKREFTDKGDILAVLRNVPDVDFQKIKEYADIFNVWDEILELKSKI